MTRIRRENRGAARSPAGRTESPRRIGLHPAARRRHQNEYVPPSEERLAWLTGFTGSAGCAIVLADRAVLFVDGRYTLQARDQIDLALFTVGASHRHAAGSMDRQEILPPA